MKKELLLIFLTLISINLVSSQPSLNLNDNYQPGETIIGNITGNFEKQISLSDMQFFSGIKEIFPEHDLTYYNGVYYFYVYPSAGNLTIRVSDILYKEDVLKSITLEKTLEIKENVKGDNETYTEILSIKPGFIFTSSTPELKLTNKGTKNISVSCLSCPEDFSLDSGDSEKISFNVNESFSYFKISSYEEFYIPVIYTSLTQNPEENNSSNTENPLFERNLFVNPSILRIKVNANKETIEKLVLSNIGNNKIKDIFIKTNISIIKIQEINNIEENSSLELNLTISSSKQGFFLGEINLSYTEDIENVSFENSFLIPLEIYVFPEGEKNITMNNDKSCSSLNGRLCNGNEICSGNSTQAYDGYCCLGNCTKEEKSSSNYLWAILIFIALGIIGYFVYKKVNKTKPLNPNDSLKEKTALYSKKISGNLSRI